MTTTQMMKAVLVDRYGSPDVLSFGEVPVPVPSRGEVRVKVHAATVNRTDTATLRAHPFFGRLMTGLIRPRMPTLGMDFAGEIDAVGAGVEGIAIGDRVFGMSPDRYGAHAEYLCVAADGAIAPIPTDIPYDEAVVGEGAWYATGTTEHLSEGQRCLVYGASGAIGTAAVQLAKARGAEVVAVVGTRHLDLAASLGADRVINYETEDFTALGEQFDVVLDAVGKTSYFACRRLLKPAGIFTATDLGPYWSNVLLGAFFGITRSRRVRIPYPDNAPGFMRDLAELMEQGRYRGVFDRRFAFEDIVSAFRYVEGGQKTGIVAIRMR